MILEIHPDNPQPRKIRQVAEALRRGELIAYPTDTVYGLGCDLLQGFGLSQPMPLADVLPTLSAWRPTVAGTPARALSV